MSRRHASEATAAQPKAVREALRASRGESQAWTTRLSKRVVQKADGRYLIYYERSVGRTVDAPARRD